MSENKSRVAKIYYDNRVVMVEYDGVALTPEGVVLKKEKDIVAVVPKGILFVSELKEQR